MESAQGLGICLSGGGLRAASFGLGCLQELDRQHGVLSGPQPARYLAAVSGGSYTAAAVSAVLAAESRDPSVTVRSAPLAAGSAEARLLAERSNYFLRHGKFALATDVAVLVLASATGLLSAVLFLPAVVTMLAIQTWLVPEPRWMADVIGVLGLLCAALITVWAVRAKPKLPTFRTRAGLVGGTAAMFATAPSLAVLVERVAPLAGPGWWLERWPALLGAVALVFAVALLLQRRDEPGKPVTVRARLGGAALGVLRLASLALAVLVPVWAVTALAGHPVVLLGVLVVAGYVLFHGLSDATSFHAFYTYRVATCFGVFRERDGSPGFLELPEVPLSFAQSADPAAPQPELLICAAANINPPATSVASFVASPVEVRLYGADGLSSIPTSNYERFEVLQYTGRSRRMQPLLTLFRAVGLSGAAVSPSMGNMTVRAARGILAFLNLRLGRWMPNPAHPEMRELAEQPGPCPLQPPGSKEALRELWGYHPADDQLVYVTDGGHFENLGIVELLRRRCALIVAVDSSGDPVGPPRSLLHSLEVARRELGLQVVMDTAPLERVALVGRTIRRCWTVGSVQYAPGVEGTVVVLRIGADPDTPDEVLQAGQGIRRFPHTSTADQFYSAAKFEAYTALGRASVATALRAPEVAAALTAWQSPAPR
jgi:hypothetical protein